MPTDPTPASRPLADHVDPSRTGSATALVNLVTRAAGIDAAAWSWGRVVGMAAQIQADAARSGPT